MMNTCALAGSVNAQKVTDFSLTCNNLRRLDGLIIQSE